MNKLFVKFLYKNGKSAPISVLVANFENGMQFLARNFYWIWKRIDQWCWKWFCAIRSIWVVFCFLKQFFEKVNNRHSQNNRLRLGHFVFFWPAFNLKSPFLPRRTLLVDSDLPKIQWNFAIFSVPIGVCTFGISMRNVYSGNDEIGTLVCVKVGTLCRICKATVNGVSIVLNYFDFRNYFSTFAQASVTTQSSHHFCASKLTQS